MNILLFDEASWNDQNSFGNTISNFFIGDVWKDDNFSNFYSRKNLPNKDMNVDYYNLASTDIVKGFLKCKIKGRRFYQYPNEKDLSFFSISGIKERKMINKLHNSNKRYFLSFINKLLWISGIWINKEFKKFIKDNNPDILFAFITSSHILIPLSKYLKKHTNCKIVLFAADELYLGYNDLPLFFRIFQQRNLKKVVKIADKLFAITDELADLYASIFNREFSLLRKSCEILQDINKEKKINNPIRMVYAGNLLYGRDDTLIKLTESISKINNDGQKVFLEIYSATEVSEKIKGKINLPESSALMGPRSNCEIKEILKKADIVLHIEALFNEKHINEVKYSFSTKITDCLQSGSVIMAIGNSSISSIQYIKKINGAIVIDNVNNITDSIEKLINDTSSFQTRISEARQFAVSNHNSNNLQNNLRKTLQTVVKCER